MPDVRRLLPLLTILLATTALVGLHPAPASAVTQLSGTILYDKGGDVFATDGATTRQITHDGGTPAADHTGSTGYQVPTQSADGSVVVAVRNQDLTSSDQQHYQRGYLWVMDAYGDVIRKLNPPQYPYQGTQTCGLPANSPQGIVNAQVSPDGKRIAYTIRQLFETWSCQAATSYATTVVNIDGSDPVQITDDGTDEADLEIGSWTDDTHLLLDRDDFGSVAIYRLTLPGPATTLWTQPGDYIDAAYAMPDVKSGVLATIGYSESASARVVRVWSTSGYGSDPTYRCEKKSVASTSDYLGDPVLSPDGSQVAYQDSTADGSTSATGQGIYLMTTSSCSTSLFVAHANDAFWSPAGITPPPRDTTPPSVSLTAPTALALAASSTTMRWSGADSGTGIGGYVVQSREAAYNERFGAWTPISGSLPADTTSVNVNGMGAGRTVCLRVVATDNAGNTAASAARCVAIALDDRSMAASSGWRRVTGSAYYLRTATTTTRTGATLTRTGARLDRVGVVVRKCASCGRIGVYVGSRLIGRVDLHGAARNKVVAMLPRFAARAATVRVKVLSSGKPVTIDGLVVDQA